MKILQFSVGGYDHNFSYIIEDAGEAIIVDPCGDINLVIDYIDTRHLKPILVINTHSHHDHVEKNAVIKQKYGVDIALHTLENHPKDMALKHKQEISVGNSIVTIYHTPGHTPGSICILAENKLLTGDVLFVETIGRTDFAESSPKAMANTLEFLKSLPDDLEILPGHDYGPTPTATLGEQKKTNPYLLKKFHN